MEHIVLDALHGKRLEDVFDVVMDLLKHNHQLRWEIFKQVEREYHLEDVRIVLEELGIDDCSEKEIERIADRYERYLSFDDDWAEVMKQAIWDELEEEND